MKLEYLSRDKIIPLQDVKKGDTFTIIYQNGRHDKAVYVATDDFTEREGEDGGGVDVANTFGHAGRATLIYHREVELI